MTKVQIKLNDIDTNEIFSVRDVWEHTDLGIFQNKIDIEIRSHEVRLFVIKAIKNNRNHSGN